MSNASLPIPMIVPGCKIKIIDDSGALEDAPRWKTLTECAYTPRAINDAMREYRVNACWVFFCGDKEYWRYNPTGALAQQARS